MTQPDRTLPPTTDRGDEISLPAVGSLLLRWRRSISWLALSGAAIGMLLALSSSRVYESTAVFIPESTPNSSSSGLALAARQFGLQIPVGDNSWGPATYVELLRSDDLLETIAMDTVTITEEGRRARIFDLLDIPDNLSPALQRERAIRELRKRVTASEDKKLLGVVVSVQTKWPSVSLAIAERLVNGVNQFNLVVRKSQATAERQFVEAQATEAARDLREAEDRLQAYELRNRSILSPNLRFEEQRLTRQVSLRQALYTSLVQNLEEAKIREVRNTPVITVLKNPRLAASSKSRGTVMKTMLGAFAGAIVGVLIAIAVEAVVAARHSPSEETRKFLQLLDEAMPRFMRRRARS